MRVHVCVCMYVCLRACVSLSLSLCGRCCGTRRLRTSCGTPTAENRPTIPNDSQTIAVRSPLLPYPSPRFPSRSLSLSPSLRPWLLSLHPTDPLRPGEREREREKERGRERERERERERTRTNKNKRKIRRETKEQIKNVIIEGTPCVFSNIDLTCCKTICFTVAKPKHSRNVAPVSRYKVASLCPNVRSSTWPLPERQQPWRTKSGQGLTRPLIPNYVVNHKIRNIASNSCK